MEKKKKSKVLDDRIYEVIYAEDGYRKRVFFATKRKADAFGKKKRHFIEIIEHMVMN